MTGSGRMFVWPSWQDCMNNVAVANKLKGVVNADRFPASGSTLHTVADRVGTQLHASAVANMDANTGGLSYDGLSTGFMVKGESTISDPL